jgi:hypothetical protein
MSVRYLCDSCGFRGVDPRAASADEVLCEVCGEPVLDDPDPPQSGGRHQDGGDGPANRRQRG